MTTIDVIENINPAISWALIIGGICLVFAFLIKFAYSPICRCPICGKHIYRKDQHKGAYSSLDGHFCHIDCLKRLEEIRKGVFEE